METLLHSLKSRLTFKNATILVCLFNLITAFFLLHGFFSSSSSSSSSSPTLPSDHSNSVQLRQIRESEEIRRAMQPLELIRRVREIEQEINAESETVQHKETKQTAAFDLSKRLSNAHTFSDSASLKALEEWRKRKMERARQREAV
ncbi:hypothetical protein RND81_14G061300 [Saponaria officinalis]|uniref:Transmembrane protein n=1 Tax=Saponaria officinalis TaxID=3572 RepID=A0AAW1GM17_SAPOF